MNLSISFEPYVPLLVLALLAAAGLAFVAFAAFRRMRGWWLRGLAFALLTAAIANPSLRQEQREPLRNVGVVIVDRSDSQRIGTRLQQVDAAEDALKRAAAQMPELDLRFVTVQSAAAARETGTKLFAALDRAMGDIPSDRFAGAIMLTDGAVHDVPPAAEQAGLLGPVHGLLSGSRSDIDRRVVVEQAPRFGIVGQQQIIRFRIEESGAESVTADVQVRFGNGEERTLPVVPGRSTELTLPLEHAGDNVVELSVSPLEGEITLDNNRALAVVNGVRDRLRVLLVSGEPHLGERTWRNMLKADPAVDLVHFTILRPPDKQDGTPVNELSLIAFPTRELFVDKIREFDLVIFDRYHREAIIPDDYVRQISDYVSAGGALLVASGPEFAEFDGLYATPMADVLAASPTGNVLEGAFKPRITAYGERHPVTAGLGGSAAANEPAWGRWFRTIDSNASEADTMMSGLDGKPLLVLSRQKEGRSAQLLSDQSWLWARGFEGGGPQAELLRRLAHWLMKEPSLEEEALSGKLENGNLTVERRTLSDKADAVTVTSPSGKQDSVELQQAAPGLWRGSLKTSENGLYRLDDGKLKSVAIGTAADSLEASDIRATAARLQPVAAATGGGMAWIEDGMPKLQMVSAGRPMNARGTIGLRANGAYRVVAASSYPLFSSLMALAAALVLLSAAWYREGR